MHPNWIAINLTQVHHISALSRDTASLLTYSYSLQIDVNIKTDKKV